MLTLTAEQKMLVSSLIDLAEHEFAEDAFTWEAEVPWDNIEQLAEHGYLGINFGEEYGGGGMTELEAMLTIETVGKICPDTGEFLYLQQMVAPRAIEMFGTEAIKEKYLPEVTGGKSAIAIAISEPGAGSDVGSMTTTAQDVDTGIEINGEKMWVSNVPESTAAVVWVKFPEGLGSVVMDLEREGIEVAQHYNNMAGRPQTHFYINEVTIPKENVLTRGKQGFKRQLQALNWERLGSATLANTVALCALEMAIEYANQREQFGQPIGEFQGIEWKLADMVKNVEAGRSLTYRAALTAVSQDRRPDRLETSLAKLFTSEMVENVVSEALQIHGANGYQRGHPVEYLYRLARGRRLAAGTDEIQKNQIASVVKKHGVPNFFNRA